MFLLSPTPFPHSFVYVIDSFTSSSGDDPTGASSPYGNPFDSSTCPSFEDDDQHVQTLGKVRESR